MIVLDQASQESHGAGTWDLWLPTSSAVPAGLRQRGCEARVPSRCVRAEAWHHRLWRAAFAKLTESLDGDRPLFLSPYVRAEHGHQKGSSRASGKGVAPKPLGLPWTPGRKGPVCTAHCQGGNPDATRTSLQRAPPEEAQVRAALM